MGSTTSWPCGSPAGLRWALPRIDRISSVGPSLVPAAEMTGKIKCAVDARRLPETLIIARTDAVARTRIVLTRRLRMYRGDPTTLSTQPPPPELEARLDHLFAQGWSACYSDAVVWGDGWMEGRNTSFAGFVSGRTVDAFGCWRLIEVLREFSRDPAGLPITLLLDSPGQAADVVNEQVILSEFVARVSEILYRLRVQGRTVELWMIGEAGGAIYVALAAAATTITAWPGLRLQTIPPAAVNQVVGERTDQKPTISALFEARVIDRWTRSPGFGEWPTQPHPPA